MIRSLAARCRPVAVLAALAAIVAMPGLVLAHAELVTATPLPNGSVIEAPDALRIEFSEAIDPESASVELLDSQQRSVAGVGAPSVSNDGMVMTVSLPDLAPAVYTVSYQVVSVVDGHATAGIYAFLIDPTGAAPPPADSARATSPSVDPLTVGARWLSLAAILAALGSLVLWGSAARPVLRSRRTNSSPPWKLVSLASLLGAVGLAAYLLLAARPIQTSGTGIPLDVAGAFGWTAFAIAMRIAIIAALVAAGTAAIAARWMLSPRGLPIGVGAVLGVVLGAMSAAGHAASYGGPAFAILDFIHLAAVAAWLGGLPAALALAGRATLDRRGALVAILRGHGPVALVAAPVVALSGIANSPLVLGARRDLVASDYGNLLVAKILLLAVAMGIGAVNHLALRGRGRVALRALVGAEVLVGVLAVSAAATMVTIQPAAARPPVLAAPPVRPAHFFTELGPSRVHVAVSLPAPGRQAYRVTVLDRDTGVPRADVQKVFLTFGPPPEAELPSERIELDPDPTTGLWSTSGAYTPLVGTWSLDITVRREGARDEQHAFELDVLDLGSAELGPPPATGIAVPAPLAALWPLLPSGPAGWLPALAALLLLAALWPMRRAPVSSLARGIATGVLLLAVAAAGSRTLVEAANATPAGASSPAVGTDLEQGRAIYLANCASCHGPNGLGKGPIRPLPAAGSLDAPIREASDAELAYRIGYGVAGTSMPAFAGQLTAEERADLIGYLRDQFGGR